MPVPRSPEKATAAVTAGEVWVVEDSRLEAERICQLLSRHYRAESFSEGGAMLERMSERPPPDLILLDWQMPGVSGLEVCRFLRERHDEVSLPILMLTARGAKEDFREGLSAGANDYVAKPYDDAELLARVRTLVRTRQQAEAVRTREERFSATLRSIGDAVITTDVEGRITFLNRAAEQLTGWRQEEACHKPVGEVLHLLDVDDGAIGENPLAVVVREGRSAEIRGRTLAVRGGGQVPIEASAGPIGESRRYGTVVVFRDVSARQAAETAARLRADFEEKLIGIVSHDLRSPLHAILLGARGLLTREELEPLTAKLALRIQSSARRATRLVDDLLDFTQARLGSGIPINRKAIDLRDIADQVLEEMEAAFPDREIRSEARGDTRGEWDADRIAQVLTNLVTNAIKYGAQDRPVRITIEGGGAGWATIEVHNDGDPIPEAILPVLFHPMKRGAASRGDRSVGLGLYIVKHIIDAHGGRIEVTSSRESGTSFVVRLPRAPAPGKLPE
jgi:PAS domain S-box-containing protein